MIKYIFSKILLIAFIAFFITDSTFACSMYKVTVDGKTMVGNNEDSWGRDSRIWFEPGINGKFSVVCVGYARKHPHADGAMNEHGLAFDAFTMYRKDNVPEKDPNKKDFSYHQVRNIMQECKTVDEVFAILDKLNLHVLNGSPIFNGGMLLFVDKTGKYLIVEANKLTLGNDDQFALANFSFADTKDLSTINTERYRNGVTFLNNKNPETSIAFCTALSDTMSVKREKIGDGTLYTNIFDLEEGLIHLFFFHDYSKRVTFNLKEEFTKGEHSYDFVELFPGNKAYEKFLAYKIPQNSMVMFVFLIACGFLFFLTSIYFGKSYLRSSTVLAYKKLRLVLAILGLAMVYYMFVLLRNPSIFYFPSPHTDSHSLMISMSSYLPFILLIGIFPLLYRFKLIVQQKLWNGLSKWLLVLNGISFLILIGMFGYWGFYDVF